MEIKAISFWEDKIIFLDGWFIYMDGKGNNSVISFECARQIERKYQEYQASMDVNRGGIEPDIAYPSRGFRNSNGRYVYKNYKVDQLSCSTPIKPIGDVLTIPSNVSGVSINYITDHAFENYTKLYKAVLPESIREIGEAAFAGCTNLNEIVIPSKHIRIKNNAFKNTAVFMEDKPDSGIGSTKTKS